jgi:tetratricopeptide (TPR) repeat protein
MIPPLRSLLPPLSHTLQSEATRRLWHSLLVCLGMLMATPAAVAQTPPAAAPEPVVNSNMSGEMLLQILLGELNSQQGEPGVAYSLLLDAARRTGDERLYKRAVDIALASRSGDAALEAASAWRQAMPRAREPNLRVLQIVLALNRVADSLGPLRTELQLAPEAERLSVIGNIPRLYARVSDRKLAAYVVEQALAPYQAQSKTGPLAWAVIGQMRLSAKDPEAALEAARRGHALNGQETAPIWLAIELMGQKHAAAEALVKQAITPQSPPDLRLGWVRVLIENQRLPEALAQLQLSTTQYPDFAPGWLLLGSVYAETGQPAQAHSTWLQFLKLAESLSPAPARDLDQAYLGLSQLALKQKDEAQAEAWLAKVKYSDKVSRVQVQRANVLARKGQMAEARRLIANIPAQTIDEKRARLFSEIHLLREFNQHAEAYQLLADALKAQPEDNDLAYELAMTAEKLERLDEMENLLKGIIARKPDYHHAYNALGYSLAERNMRLDEALALIQKALSFAPDDPFITDSLGWVEFRRGNVQQALQILQKAYRARPDPEIAAHLGEVHWVLNQKEQALQVWREGLALNPDNTSLRDTLRRLGAPL